MFKRLKHLFFQHKLTVTLFTLFFVIYLIVGFMPKPQGVSQTSGDEGHYLVMTYSLLHDGDLDLIENYNNFDYREWYPPPHLTPHLITFKDKLYPLHQPGLSIAILPIFALAQRPGVVVFLALLTTISMLNLRAILNYFVSKKIALFTTLVIALSAPVLTYSVLIYPEVAILFLVSWIFRIILNPKFKLTIANSILLIILFACIPPQHMKFGLLMGVIFLYILVNQYKKVPLKWLISFLGTAGVVSSLYLVWMHTFFDGDLLGAMKPIAAGNSFKFEYVFSGLLGSLIDRENGILIFSPLYIYIFIGFIIFFKNFKSLSLQAKYTRIFITAMIVIQSVFVTMYPHILGGQNPAGRYFLPIIPAIAIVLAITFNEMLKIKLQQYIIGLFAVYTIFISLVIMSNPFIVLPFGGGSNMFTYILKDNSVIVHKMLPNLSKYERTITTYDYQKGISITLLIFFISISHLLRDPVSVVEETKTRKKKS